MNSRIYIGLMAAAAVVIISTAAAAPLPPFPPVNICGVIVEQSWIPTEFAQGRPGFSGSLGHDRTFPAHVRIILENYTGIDATIAKMINGFLSVTELSEMNHVLLLLPTENPELLRGVHRLCIEGLPFAVTKAGHGRLIVGWFPYATTNSSPAMSELGPLANFT